MNEKIDQGNIIFQRTVPIDRNETGIHYIIADILFAKDIVSIESCNGYNEIQKIIKKNTIKENYQIMSCRY